jgi:hypothetical protein
VVVASLVWHRRPACANLAAFPSRQDACFTKVSHYPLVKHLAFGSGLTYNITRFLDLPQSVGGRLRTGTFEPLSPHPVG